MLSDPGLVPVCRESVVRKPGRSALLRARDEEEEDDDELSGSEAELFAARRSYVGEDWTICTRCESYRPPRAHHCRICRRCVRKMDHHCECGPGDFLGIQ